MNNFPIPTGLELQQKMNLPNTPVYHRRGGFKAVYTMKNARNVDEALKAIFIPRAESEQERLQRNQLIARAKREIAALSECSSAGIVKLGGIKAEMVELQHADYLVYSEEMLKGEPLASRLAPGSPQMDFESLRLLLLTLVRLIGDLHAINYLHRDIKPDNIMDTGDPNRRFVALDMGIAYKLHGTDITQGPNPPGTLRYMAPELLGPNYKDSMDYRSEIYSAGLTVYVLASKSHPFAPMPEHAYATLYRIMNTHPQPLARLRPDLPQAFCQIIDRCIRKRAALRYSSIDILINEIERI